MNNLSWECHYGSWGGPWVPKGGGDEKVSQRVVRSPLVPPLLGFWEPKFEPWRSLFLKQASWMCFVGDFVGTLKKGEKKEAKVVQQRAFLEAVDMAEVL